LAGSAAASLCAVAPFSGITAWAMKKETTAAAHIIAAAFKG
jgi:hypothetical protein